MRSLKKVLALMLSLAMVFSMLTVTAVAETSDIDKYRAWISDEDAQWTNVATWDDFKLAISTANADTSEVHYFKLTDRIPAANADLPVSTTINSDVKIVIDLNGHNLCWNNKTTGKDIVTNNGELVILDTNSSANNKGQFFAGGPNVPLNNHGTAAFLGGYFVRYSDYSTKSEIGFQNSETLSSSPIITNDGTVLVDGAKMPNANIASGGTVKVYTGYFGADPSSYIQDGYKVVGDTSATGCNYMAMKKSDAEALIGTTEYTTLADAFEAAENGDTILLNKDVTVSERIELEVATKEAKRAIDFNMNGKKVTYTGEKSGLLLVRAYDTVNISGDGIVDIQAGDFFFTTNQYAKVNVTDGTFTGATKLSATAYGPSTMSISGGIWSIDPSNQMSTGTTPKAYSGLAEGYVAVAQGTTPETWLVKEAPAAELTVNGKATIYSTFDEAFTAAIAASGNVVVKVLESTSSEGNFYSDVTTAMPASSITLDLNGKTLSVNNGLFCRIKTAFTIDDLSNTQEGKILCTAGAPSNNGFIYNNIGKTLTINAGTIEANFTSGHLVNASGFKAAHVTVNGGKLIPGDGANAIRTNNAGIVVTVNDGYIGGPITRSVANSELEVLNGGTFEFEPSEDDAVINGEVIDNADGTWSVVPKMTAKLFANGEEIGEYTVDQALKEGYQAYTDGDSITVMLLDDAISGGNLDLSTKSTGEGSSRIYNAPDITLDLNNHQLIVTGSQFVKLKAKFTIDDTSDDKGGSIEAITESVSGTGIFYINGGKDFTINNGYISAYLEEGKFLINSAGFSEDIYINGGTLDAGSGCAIRAGGSSGNPIVHFTGGTICSPVQFDLGSGVATGGSFIADPAEWGIAVEGIYTVIENEETGYYDVIVDPYADYIVEYDGTQYQTVAAAVADILATPTKTGTITFITDAMLREGVINVDDADANITFDLNECFIQEDSVSQLFLLEKGNFTIKNGNIYASGQIETSGHIRVNNATLLVKDIIFDGDKFGEEVTNINKSNGGAFYIYGSDATFDNTLIKNCRVADEATGKGNSGAMHIVKQSVDNVANVAFTNGSKIDNCQAANQGGAISVGSGCTFTLGEDCAISNCKAAMGGAIYIDISDDKNFPAVTDHLCGKAFINGEITNCTSKGDSTAPIASRGFAFIDGDLTTTGDVFQRESVAALDSGSLTLDGNLTYTLSMIVAKTTDEASKEVSFVVTLDGEEVPEEQLEISGNDITIKGIKASQMGAKITVQAQITDGARSISNAEETSIVDYCEKAFDPENEKLDTLLANLLNYGKEVQKEWSASCDEPVVIPACLESYVTTDAPSGSAKAVTKAATMGDRYKIQSATLNLDEKIAMIINVWEKPDKLCSVKVSDGNTTKTYSGSALLATETGYVYRVELDRLNPLQYNDTYTISLMDKHNTDIVIHEVTYSVNSYCVAKTTALTTAIYNYGTAAEAFAAE